MAHRFGFQQPQQHQPRPLITSMSWRTFLPASAGEMFTSKHIVESTHHSPTRVDSGKGSAARDFSTPHIRGLDNLVGVVPESAGHDAAPSTTRTGTNWRISFRIPGGHISGLHFNGLVERAARVSFNSKFAWQVLHAYGSLTSSSVEP